LIVAKWLFSCSVVCVWEIAMKTRQTLLQQHHIFLQQQVQLLFKLQQQICLNNNNTSLFHCIPVGRKYWSFPYKSFPFINDTTSTPCRNVILLQSSWSINHFPASQTLLCSRMNVSSSLSWWFLKKSIFSYWLEWIATINISTILVSRESIFNVNLVPSFTTLQTLH
jgi:hypothetical protein